MREKYWFIFIFLILKMHAQCRVQLITNMSFMQNLKKITIKNEMWTFPFDCKNIPDTYVYS